jgi:hypothetical protein
VEPEREMEEVEAEGSPPTGLAEQDGHSGNNGNQSFQVLNWQPNLPLMIRVKSSTILYKA